MAVFTARRNARIPSAVLATAIPSVCLSVRQSVCPSICSSHAGNVSQRRHVARAVCTIGYQNVSSSIETKKKYSPGTTPYP